MTALDEQILMVLFVLAVLKIVHFLVCFDVVVVVIVVVVVVVVKSWTNKHSSESWLKGTCSLT